MKIFIYQAKKTPKEIVEGEVQAASQEDAVQKILGMNLFPVSILLKSSRDKTELSREFLFGFLRPAGRVSVKERISFTRQLADLTGASVPLLDALRIIQKSFANVFLGSVILRMSDAVEDGASLPDALSLYPRCFSLLYVRMIGAAELSGELSVVLNKLAAHLEEEHAFQNKVAASLAYPSLIFATGILTVGVLLTFVIPRLSVLFSDMNQELPYLTQIILGAGIFFSRFWWIFAIAIICFVFFLRRMLLNSEQRTIIDRFILRLPVIGRFLKQKDMARFFDMLALLLVNGVRLPAALDACAQGVKNQFIRKRILSVSFLITQGEPLRNLFVSLPEIIPENAARMVAVGEETGSLEENLKRIAVMLRKETEQTAAVFLSLLSPAVLIIVVAFVGVIVLGLVLPVLQMNIVV